MTDNTIGNKSVSVLSLLTKALWVCMFGEGCGWVVGGRAGEAEASRTIIIAAFFGRWLRDFGG